MRTCINECKSGHKPDCTETETHRACQYREATRGMVCEICYSELRDALMVAPAIVNHLRSIYGGLSGHSSDGSQKVKREPPAPFNLSAYELCENIYRTIVGNIIPVGASPARVANDVRRYAEDALHIYDVVVNLEDVKELSKVIKMVKTARKIYPLQEDVRTTAMPCPECNLLTVYTPPQQFGDAMNVSCEACGFEVPPDKIAFYAYLAEKEQKRA